MKHRIAPRRRGLVVYQLVLILLAIIILILALLYVARRNQPAPAAQPDTVSAVWRPFDGGVRGSGESVVG